MLDSRETGVVRRGAMRFLAERTREASRRSIRPIAAASDKQSAESTNKRTIKYC